MKRIRVIYMVAEDLYSKDYRSNEAFADLDVDDSSARALLSPLVISLPRDSNIVTLELLLEQLENLRHRTYLAGSISEIEPI